MSGTAGDFVNFPHYLSPWLTPPSTLAEPRRAKHGHDVERAGDVIVDDDRDDCKNTILGWIEENTRLNTSRSDMLDVRGGTHVKRLNKLESRDTTAMKLCRQQEKTNYFYNKDVFANGSTGDRNYHTDRSYHTDCSYYSDRHCVASNFYHLACIAPEDVTPPQRQDPPLRSVTRLGCHGEEEHDEDDDDDDDDHVIDFLETYRRAPEPTKFQAKVYLELWRDHQKAQNSLFVCPDDSKKFITVHDFSSNQGRWTPSTFNINDGINSNNNMNTNIANGCSRSNTPNVIAGTNYNVYANNNSDSFISGERRQYQLHQQHLQQQQQHNAYRQYNVRYPSGQSQLKSHYSNNIDVNSNFNNLNNSLNNNVNIGSSVRSLYADCTTYAKTYAFDRIFTPEENTLDVYIESVTLAMKAVMSGHNGCVVCYGEPEDSLKAGSVGNSLTGLILRWLYALLEESSHDSLATYSVKVSAVEFAGGCDSTRDLLADHGMRVKIKDQASEEEDQPRFIRVASHKEALDVLRSSLKARSAPNTLFTVHLRQYHARVPSHRRVVSLSNQLHVISVSDRQRDSKGSARDGPAASLAGRDNLLQFIGSLMIGQRLPLSSLSRLQALLQNCILPGSAQCQSCLLLRLGRARPCPTRDLQRLLSLGTKIYKRRFSRNKHLKHGTQPLHLMNSSASETSSCASSGLSNLRKSRVRMGTRQWPRKTDPVPAHCPPTPVDLDLGGRATRRPDHLELERKFAPKVGTGRRCAPSPSSSSSRLFSPVKGHRKVVQCSRPLQDSIPEQPEDRWEALVSSREFETSCETWIDGPALAACSDDYANLIGRKGAANAREMVPSNRSFQNLPPTNLAAFWPGATASSGQWHQSSVGSYRRADESRPSFSHSISTFRTVLANQSQSTGFISRIHANPLGVQPTKAYDSSDALLADARFPELQERKQPLLGSIDTAPYPSQGLSGKQSVLPPALSSRKGSLPNDTTTSMPDRRRAEDSFPSSRFASSSVYESRFEKTVEEATGSLLTESFTTVQSASEFGGGRTVRKCSDDNDYERIRVDSPSGNDQSSEASARAAPEGARDMKEKKEKRKNHELLKKFRRLFARNPFKRDSSSSSSLSSFSTLPSPFSPGTGLAGTVATPPPESFRLECERHGSKRRFSLFARQRRTSKPDHASSTAPPTPSIYYDNQAVVGTMPSTNGSSPLGFPSLSNPVVVVDSSRSTNGIAPGPETGVAGERVGDQGSVRGWRSGDFFAFAGRKVRKEDDDDDDGESHVESSVADVVCYRKMQFPGKGRASDQCKADSTLLEPSYYRFSKLSSDGDLERDQQVNTSNNTNTNSNNNNNSNNKRISNNNNSSNSGIDDSIFNSNSSSSSSNNSSTTSFECDCSKTGGSGDTSDKIETSDGFVDEEKTSRGGVEAPPASGESTSSTLTTIKEAILRDDDDDGGGDDDDSDGEEDDGCHCHGCDGDGDGASGGDDNDRDDDEGGEEKMPKSAGALVDGTAVKKRRLTGFIFKRRQTSNKRKGCSLQ